MKLVKLVALFDNKYIIWFKILIMVADWLLDLLSIGYLYVDDIINLTCADRINSSNQAVKYISVRQVHYRSEILLKSPTNFFLLGA